MRSISTLLYITFVFCLLSSSCSDSGSEKEKNRDLTLTFKMDSCSDFGSNLTFVYHIFSNYVEHHRGKLACDDKSMNVEVPLEPGKYSVNVFLVKDHNEKNEYDPENMSILQAGSTTFTISDSTTVEVPMGNYEGGIFAKWPVEICSAFQTDTMKFSIKDGKGETVNSVIWGVETKLEQFPVNCSAGELRIMDIPEDSYDVKIEGFRKKARPLEYTTKRTAQESYPITSI